MEIYKRLKELRDEYGYTQDELAKKLHISRSAIANYENNSRSPDFEMLCNIAEVYNLTLNELLGEELITHKDAVNKNHKIKKNKIMIFVATLFVTLIILVSNSISTEHNYGYDIHDTQEKVNNSSVISIVDVIEKINNKDIYKVEVIHSLKGSSFSYLSIKNKDIEIDVNTCYLVFGNFITDYPKKNKNISIDVIEIYDYLCLYELDNYNKANSISNQTPYINNIIDFYSYYIANEKKDNIIYSSLINSEDKEITITSKDKYANPYHSFDLNNDFDKQFNYFYNENFKFMDIEIILSVENFKSNIGSIYLFREANHALKQKISSMKIKFYLLNENNYDYIILSFKNIPISLVYDIENPEIYIRYDKNNNFIKNFQIKNIYMKIGYRM